MRISWLWLTVLLLLGGHRSATPSHAQAPTPIREFVIGYSAQGRPIEAVQVGTGPRKLVIVGNTHGAPEANTYELTRQLIDYYRSHPQAVPDAVRLYLIPTINPDGVALGWRFDAFGVDLNRNMNTNLDECSENDWNRSVFGAYGIVSDTGGAFPDSQLESRVIRNFLLDASGVIFIHSNAGLVFPAFCEHAPSIRMAELYAAAAEYEYQRYWERYFITGGMHDWAASLGIAAIIPELVSPVDPEYGQNLRGIQAVLAAYAEVLPLPADQVVNGQPVPAVIWRYWRAHGGDAVFGLPLEPPRQTALGIQQTFARARLEYRPSLTDTLFVVQPVPVQADLTSDGSISAAFGTLPIGIPADGLASPMISDGPLFFEQSGYSLGGGFQQFWTQNGGMDVFGVPRSTEQTARTADGQLRTVQFFERAIFAYDADTEQVQLEPVGWQVLLREQVRAPTTAPQIR